MARSREPRILAVSFTASAVLHILAIVLYPIVMDRLTPGETATLPGVAVPPQGTRIVQITEVTGTEIVEPLPEEEEPEPVPAERPRPAAGAPGTPEPTLPGEAPLAAERLRPREGDPRLWAPLEEEIPSLTEHQLYELELAGRLDAWNDSVGAEAERRRAMTDWTYTDDEGRRWGVSPGQIHLGGVTLPLPFGFIAPLGKRDEAARRAWEWDEIEAGAASAAAQQSWRERAEAIRKRKDAERAAARERPEPPDTTRRRPEDR